MESTTDTSTHATVTQAGPAPPKIMEPSLIRNEIAAEPPIDDREPAIDEAPDPAWVTPLENLSADGQLIDCPFCLQRSTVRMNKVGTNMQTVVGVVLCCVCVCLACLPCLAGCFENTEFSCSSCSRRVACLPHDGPMQTFAPETEQAQVPSLYPPAIEPPEKAVVA